MIAMPRILVVEDEAPIREGLRDHLRRSGYGVSTADTIAAAEPQLAAADLVILDRRLPDGDGLDVLRRMRSRGMQTPVIVLSALGETADRVAGLEDGADDYMTKPFALRELVVRVRAVLHRSVRHGEVGGELAFGDCVLDIGARTLARAGRPVGLSRMEFDLLVYFRRNAGRAVSRNELLDRVWGYDRFPTTRTVDYHVLALRKKIESTPESPRHIITIHRVGYRFEP